MTIDHKSTTTCVIFFSNWLILVLNRCYSLMEKNKYDIHHHQHICEYCGIMNVIPADKKNEHRSEY